MKRMPSHKRRWKEKDLVTLMERHLDLAEEMTEAVHLVVERLQEVNEWLDRIEKQIDPEIEIEEHTGSERSVN